jgi:RNA polymerase sigma-70 factor (ECF subfamily)
MTTALSFVERTLFAFPIRLETPAMPIPSTATENELARWLREGNREAIAVLIQRHSPRLLRYLVPLVNNPSVAEDVLQETWLRVMEHIDGFNPNCAFMTWLFAIAHNCAIDVLRHEKRFADPKADERSDESGDWMDRVPDERPSVLSELQQEEMQSRTQKIFAFLPAHYREVLALRFQQEMPLNEIARAVHLPLSTVKTRIKRGLELLRDKVVAVER